jgi:hypothetical protein
MTDLAAKVIAVDDMHNDVCEVLAGVIAFNRCKHQLFRL